MLLSAAGTLPEPAVSVPSASGTIPRATATADPELDPPLTRSAAQGIARHPVGRAHANETGRELVEVGLADDDRAGALQPRHGLRIMLRHVGECGASGGRRQASDIDVVLHRDGDAVERKIGITHLQATSVGQHLGFFPQRYEDRGVADLADALEHTFDRLCQGNRA